MKPLFGIVLSTVLLVAPAMSAQAPHASTDVAQLIQQLRDPNLQNRRDATNALAEIKPLSPHVIDAMVSLLEQPDQDSAIQRMAQAALCEAGSSAIPAAQDLAQSTNGYAAQNGIEILGCLAVKDRTVWPILIDIYREHPAGDAISELSRVGSPVVPFLIDALKSGDPVMRVGALRTLGKMVEYGRMSSASAMARHKLVTPQDLAPAVPEFLAALQNKDPNLRSQAALLLNYADPKDPRPLPFLTNLVAKRDALFGRQAIQALQTMGTAAEPAAPILRHALLTEPDNVLRSQAAFALVQIEGQKACSPLKDAIAKERRLPDPFISAILEIKPPCPHIIPVLIGTFPLEFSFSSPATRALSAMRSAAVPALTAALTSSNLYVRQNAAVALAGMKPLPPDAARALLMALNDRNLQVRRMAVGALQPLGGEPKKAADAVEKRDEAKSEKPKLDSRLYSRELVAAPVPPNDEFMYPLTLTHILPLQTGGSARLSLLVTVHTGKDRPDRLVFWKKVGNDQYQQVEVMYAEDPEDYADLGNHFDAPFAFHAAYERITHRGTTTRRGFFVDVPTTEWRRYDNNVFIIENDHVTPVRIDSPYVGPYAGSDFHDGKLEFSDHVYNRGDPNCCPTGGSIVGTYKIVEDARQNPPDWKIVVATTKRVPPPPGLHSSRTVSKQREPG